MPTDHPTQVVVGLTGPSLETGEVRVSSERFVRIDLPQSLTKKHVELMQKDFAILSEIASEYPDDVAELQNAVLANDFGTANQVAAKIGLTEKELVAKGGGQIGVAVGILVVLVIYALASEGHESPPPTPAPDAGPPPTDGGPDAGPG